MEELKNKIEVDNLLPEAKIKEGHRAGFVNIVGNPNVGKSTLMNDLVGERISIITSKAQTTRHRIMGIVNVRNSINTKEKAVSDYETRLKILEDNQDACENLQDINARIEQKKIEQRRLMGYINLDYNAMLLDDMWILRAYHSVLSEYQKKVSALSREKRKLQKAEDERIAIEKGKLEAIKEIQKLA